MPDERQRLGRPAQGERPDGNDSRRAELEAYLHHLAHERRGSPLTLVNYRRDLQGIDAWLSREGLGPWEGLDAQTVRRFVAARHRGGASGRTLQRTLSALRGLYRYLLREGRIGHNPAQGITERETRARLDASLGRLPKRERCVITYRFGLAGSRPHTLDEVSRRIGLTRERVRQVEAKAIRKLQHPVRARKLEGFLDNKSAI